MLALLLATSSSDAVGAGLGIFMLICYGVLGLIFLALFIFWIIMLVDCIKRPETDFPNSSGNSKTIWLVVLLVSWLIGFSWLAAIIYYFMVKRAADKMPQAPTAPPTPPAM
jgi:hypothetical protein